MGRRTVTSDRRDTLSIPTADDGMFPVAPTNDLLPRRRIDIVAFLDSLNEALNKIEQSRRSEDGLNSPRRASKPQRKVFRRRSDHFD